ncbi:TadE/TadG family type IV pilus assembly protein [Corallococcus silvisoli]|uniref:TadE/TadG family type IV pilus assembly protein n=1 Tax=Corallococcus silvisoli TaxID=2697031 RepID=UPI0013779528|nr:TadE family protein [Corallococcus silvisoli]NBD09859.1 pilus assembly protein [Corallococcus silvisoli]
MSARSPREAGESGQALVEAALSLPLVVFLILGALQLFLMMQARVMTHYAAFRATRAGSVAHGDCERMTHAAILALIPTFHSFMGQGTGSLNGPLGHGAGGDGPRLLANAFAARMNNRYAGSGAPGPGLDGIHNRSIVWILRDLAGGGVDSPEDSDFDRPGHLRRLEVQLVFWYPLRIPFANWVMSRMFLAHFGLRPYTDANPLLVAERNANWNAGEVSPSHVLDGELAAELADRVNSRQYVFPIITTFTMRMMTPVKARFFATMNCPR